MQEGHYCLIFLVDDIGMEETIKHTIIVYQTETIVMV